MAVNPATYCAQVLYTRGTTHTEPQTVDDLRKALAKAVLKSRRDAIIRGRDPDSVQSDDIPPTKPRRAVARTPKRKPVRDDSPSVTDGSEPDQPSGQELGVGDGDS